MTGWATLKLPIFEPKRAFFPKEMTAFKAEKIQNTLDLQEPQLPKIQKKQFLSTNIGQRLTKKSLGVHLLWPTEVAEGRSGTEDRSKKAKNHMIQVDLIEVSSPQAEIFIQGRPS